MIDRKQALEDFSGWFDRRIINADTFNYIIKLLQNKESQPIDVDKLNIELMEFYEANEKYDWKTKDTAPRDGTEFLAYMDGCYYLVDFSNGNFLDEYSEVFSDFTHWIPIKPCVIYEDKNETL